MANPKLCLILLMVKDAKDLKTWGFTLSQHFAEAMKSTFNTLGRCVLVKTVWEEDQQ